MEPTMPKLAEVRPLDNLRLWVRYSDGSQGEVDLSDLAGRGVFSSWETPGSFESVRVGFHGELQWSEDIELCADSVYMRLTGKTPE
ncbi:MAG TPA: DUF2442 domain-containing protein, partial [Acidobacteriota bacterium]|nr:DUF2442 domain-containing protein [Acidobacteriota bacterium]